MVSKKNFPQNGRLFLQHHQRYDQRLVAAAGGIASTNDKKPFRQMHSVGAAGFNTMLFNASQIPDNPGYVDFNNPTPPLASAAIAASHASANGNQIQISQKRKNQKNKQKGKVVTVQQQQQHLQPHNTRSQQTVKGWHNNKNKQILQHSTAGSNRASGRFHSAHAATRGFNAMLPMNGPNRIGGRRQFPVPLPRAAGPILPMPFMPMNGFQPPIIPPPLMPPVGRGPMPPAPPHAPPPPPPHHFLRRSARGAPMPPPPMPPIPPMMQPRLPRGVPPMPYNGRIKKLHNTKLNKKVIKGKSTIKTLKNLINQYPLDKPWVTDEIRVEHDKKVDIENRLKGHKDDDLFATFKVQRDKFVALYETAREEHLKQEAAAVKAKDAKDKQTTSKNPNKDKANPNANANV